MSYQVKKGQVVCLVCALLLIHTVADCALVDLVFLFHGFYYLCMSFSIFFDKTVSQILPLTKLICLQ